MMEVKAKFKGKHGSLGYLNEKDYLLDFKVDSEKGNYFVVIREIINRRFGGALITLRNDSVCTYSSLRKFLDNWEVL